MPKLHFDVYRGVREKLKSGMIDTNAIAEDLGVQPRTVRKYKKMLNDEQSQWLEFLVKGGYIQKFKQTLDTMDTQAAKTVKEIEELKATYATRNMMLHEELDNYKDDPKKFARIQLIQAMLNNDSNYFNTLERMRKTVKDIEKNSLDIQSGTGLVWAFKKFVQANTPMPIDDPREEMLEPIAKEGEKFETRE